MWHFRNTTESVLRACWGKKLRTQLIKDSLTCSMYAGIRVSMPRHGAINRVEDMAWLAEAARFNGLLEEQRLVKLTIDGGQLRLAVHTIESLPQLAPLLVGMGYSEKLADCILMCDLPVESGFWG